MGSLQFLGIEDTLKAFEYRDVKVWSIFDGKRMIHKGAGETDLREFLEMISRSGTAATYILKVYEDIDDPKQVKSNTPDDGSFSFKLFGYESAGMGGIVPRHYGDPVQAKILERLGAIEQQINGEEGEEPDFIKSIGDAFIGMIQEPGKLGEFIEVIKPIFGGPQPYNPMRAGIGNVKPVELPKQTNEGGLVLTEESLQRIGDAIEKIAVQDPKIVEHLEKLAAMAEKNPVKFRSTIGLFDTVL